VRRKAAFAPLRRSHHGITHDHVVANGEREYARRDRKKTLTHPSMRDDFTPVVCENSYRDERDRDRPSWTHALSSN
jgi:hypothetical protein